MFRKNIKLTLKRNKLFFPFPNNMNFMLEKKPLLMYNMNSYKGKYTFYVKKVKMEIFMYLIYPKPLKVESKGNFFTLDKKVVFFETPMENVCKELQSFVEFKIGSQEKSNIIFSYKHELREQAYELVITDGVINVYASQEVGFFYAVKTLKQIMGSQIECGYIYDEPDLKVRGFMMDISRNKVPTLETIKYIVDIMSDLKMNHLELYVEGFSFEYKSFSQYLQDESYITIEEYQELERYANSKYIDLVPNQNGFGHMAPWLKLDEFKDLAEAPEGIFLWGTHRAPSTLNPLDPRSIELIKKMYADMLPYSNSQYFNMNFDEPFELGKGRSKEACEKEGLVNVYLEYTKKAYDEIKKYNKTPLIWGDVLIRHDDALTKIPSDMIFVDWGYDATYPFDKNLLKLKKANIKFMAAPGTSSWCSFLGRTNDALLTIYNACVFTKQYGGEGILVTDWGDFGHLQFLPITFAPLVYAGLLSYRCNSGTIRLLKHYLNKYIFKDDAQVMADLIMDLGNYYRYENSYVDNGTQAFHCLMWACNAMKEDDKIAYFKAKMQDKVLTQEKYSMINDFFALKVKELNYAHVDQLIKDELTYSINLVKTLLKINISLNEKLDKQERIKHLESVIASENALIEGLKNLWLQRNKKSGLEDSINYIEKMMSFVKILLGGLYEA